MTIITTHMDHRHGVEKLDDRFARDPFGKFGLPRKCDLLQLYILSVTAVPGRSGPL